MNLSLKRPAPAHAVRVLLATVALALFGSDAASSYAADSLLRTIAFTGQVAPGTAGLARFDAFSSPPFINSSGHTAFNARLRSDGPLGAEFQHGVWSEGSGSLTLVARHDDPAPGLPQGTSFDVFASPVINNAGQTAFLSGLKGPLIFNVSSIWSESNGRLELVAHNGDPARGFPSESFVKLPHQLLHSFNEGIVISANSGAEASREIWRVTSDGDRTLVVSAGSQAPGTSGESFASFDYPTVASNGDMAFRATLQPNEAPGATGISGIWSEREGVLSLLARAGSYAPGTSQGVRFLSFGQVVPSISSGGNVAFPASLAGAGVTSINNSGIWSSREGEPRLLVREGDPVPGFSGYRFSNFHGPVLIDAEGQTAFFASMLRLPGASPIDGDGVGLWMERDGELQPIVRSGMQAPGLPSGTVFSVDPFEDVFVLNDAGRVAIMTSGGLWAEDVAGALRLIVRMGQTLEVAPGDFRTVSHLGFKGAKRSNHYFLDRSHGSGFNNAGQVAFFAGFTDGSHGLFASNLATLPEPGVATLISTATALTASSLRRRSSLR